MNILKWCFPILSSQHQHQLNHHIKTTWPNITDKFLRSSIPFVKPDHVWTKYNMPSYTMMCSAHSITIIELFWSHVCLLFPLLHAFPSWHANILIFQSVPWNTVTTQWPTQSNQSKLVVNWLCKGNSALSQGTHSPWTCFQKWSSLSHETVKYSRWGVWSVTFLTNQQ